MIRALPVVDRLERGGRTLLLLEHQVVELSELALAAYDTVVAAPLSLTELTGRLVAEFGVPEGDPEVAMQGIVDELVGLGLVSPSHG